MCTRGDIFQQGSRVFLDDRLYADTETSSGAPQATLLLVTRQDAGKAIMTRAEQDRGRAVMTHSTRICKECHDNILALTKSGCPRGKVNSLSDPRYSLPLFADERRRRASSLGGQLSCGLASGS